MCVCVCVFRADNDRDNYNKSENDFHVTSVKNRLIWCIFCKNQLSGTLVANSFLVYSRPAQLALRKTRRFFSKR